MTRYIEVEVEGVTAVARLLDDKAPGTSQRLWDALPVQLTLRHLSWAGEGAFVRIEKLQDPDFPLENRLSFYMPGTICYRPENVEVVFCYRQCQARTLVGRNGNLYANHFASFEEPYDKILQIFENTHEEGAKQLTIRRRES
jgi:hypothetical protein